MSEHIAHAWLDHAAPYALGALDEADRAPFEAHLASCATCSDEVRALQEVAGLLALAAPRVVPPTSLRERIVAGARAVRPIATAPSHARTAQTARRAGAVPWVAAAAAILLAVVLGQRYRGERDARTAVERALTSVRSSLDSATGAIARRDSLIASLVAPDVQAVSVSGTGPSPSARYFLDRRAGRIVIAASALPPAAPGRTYQLWGIETGRAPVSLGTFDTDSSGRALATLRVPPGLRIAVTAVTDEPTGGSPQPTTTPFLAATWRTE